MRDIADVVKGEIKDNPGEEVKENPSENNPLVILVKDMRYKDGTEVSLDKLDPNELYYFRFTGIGGAFKGRYNFPFKVEEIREKIKRLGVNKKYYVSQVREDK